MMHRDILPQAAGGSSGGEGGKGGSSGGGGGGGEGGGGGGGASSSGGAMPSSEALNSAHLEQFGNQNVNNTYKTTIGGESYFVKTASDKGNAIATNQMHNEVNAYQAGVQMGVGNFLIPTHATTLNGAEAVIAPWTSGKSFLEMSGQQKSDAAAALSTHDFTKAFLFESLINDGDRHEGNYMYDAATKQLKIIDLGFAGRAEALPFEAADSKIATYRAQGLGVMTANGLPLDPVAIQEVASYKDAVIAGMRQRGVDPTTIAGYEARYAHIAHMATLPNPKARTVNM